MVQKACPKACKPGKAGAVRIFFRIFGWFSDRRMDEFVVDNGISSSLRRTSFSLEQIAVQSLSLSLSIENLHYLTRCYVPLSSIIAIDFPFCANHLVPPPHQKQMSQLSGSIGFYFASYRPFQQERHPFYYNLPLIPEIMEEHD
jgi:hypothetical protein